MIHRATLDDADYINDILRHPDVYKGYSSDGYPDRQEIDCSQFLKDNQNYFLLGDIGQHVSSLFVYYPMNFMSYEAHIYTLPGYRGKIMLYNARESIKWMFKNTLCEKIIGMIASYNMPARAIAMLCGLKQEGRLERAVKKNGIYYDRIIMGICKNEVKNA